jgi:BirA family biotin operon repressor/biotin-[acetyl-CoA-carboxylase] ligase
MPDSFLLVKSIADGRFHSGRELGEILGISRAAVWKKIQWVKNRYQLEIDAVKGRGYRLKSPIELLESDVIADHLRQHGMQNIPPIELHTTLESTNTWLMQQGGRDRASRSVCLAEQQVAGKGRHGRHWVSPFGRNLYFSMLFHFDLSPMQVASLSLASAIGVVRLLRQLNCKEVGLKWPNDVLWQGRKLAGLLLEVAGEVDGPSQVVIGVGLNTQLGEYAKDIDQPWIDLNSISGIHPYTRNELAAGLIMQLIDVVETYQNKGFGGFIEEWHDYDLLLGKKVVIKTARQSYQGKHLGIDLSGGIHITVNGTVQSFHAGEVSLRAHP